MTQRDIQLRHSWGCHPLWDQVDESDVDPVTLNLPPSLIDRLDAWAARWDQTFDLHQPDRRRVEPFVIDDLGQEGARLWRALLGLLDPQLHTITYLHEDTVYRTIDELPPAWRFG